jgi:hypothetical protein
MIDAAQAERDWQSVNPFVIGDMLPSIQAWQRLERARVAAYERGECCGCGGIDGECNSRAVQRRRRERLAGQGMGSRGVAAMCRLCERSEQWAEIEMVYRVANETGHVTVAEAAAAIERAKE